MLFTYLILVIGILFALFMPISFLLTSKLLGPNPKNNKIKGAPYESGEEVIGSAKDIDNEYLGFFSIFLSFEIIVIILLLWASVSNYLQYTSSLLLISISIISMVLSLIGYKIASEINE
ncbi:MAG: NADH-quinone oxidoreductase subunit A [Candidatus Marsarchaeota archaeon]|nr:NADH-quinone oxidoreductase subunit A [Candidatus Marsarchaeota archaeon]MCL5094388.1 NADH-quinone oxidoreductase subunit A [Candidatus Marsarchaeota archaeon]